MLHGRDGRTARFGNTDEFDRYIAGEARCEVESVDRTAQLEEAWFLGLRLVAGVSLERLRGEFGDKALGANIDALGELSDARLLTREGDLVALTMRGRMLSNEVFGRLLS